MTFDDLRRPSARSSFDPPTPFDERQRPRRRTAVTQFRFVGFPCSARRVNPAGRDAFLSDLAAVGPWLSTLSQLSARSVIGSGVTAPGAPSATFLKIYLA